MLPRLSKADVEKFRSEFKFGVSIGLSYRWQSHDSDVTTFSTGFQVPVQSFSGKEHSRRATALVDNIELKSFTDVAIDARAESNLTEGKIKTGVEKNPPLTNGQFFLLII